MKHILTVFSATKRPRHARALAAALGALIIAVTAYSTLSVAPAPKSLKLAASETKKPYFDLSAEDVHLYSQAFLAAKNGDHAKVDELLSQTESQVLLGHVLAERYLHESYTTNREELALWLENFADHPQTARIAALAGRKGVSQAKSYADLSPLLSGRGYTDHLGARSLPSAWYQGLGAWRSGRYAQAASAFISTARADISDWHKAAGYFWAARAYSKLRNADATETALENAARYDHTFYGMLAVKMLGTSPAFSAASPYISASLEEASEYIRARALSAVGEADLAESELRRLFMRVAEHQRREVLAMAGELGLANLQIRLSRMDGLSEDEQLFASYPVSDAVLRATETMDSALVMAVARQESAFKQEVKSHAGASGMMQVMPGTARHVMSHPQFASLSKEPSATLGRLNLRDAETNIHVGASYLNMLANEKIIASNLVKVLAAYNAGPGNVASWEKTARKVSDPLLYIESIPFAETRNYVVQVLAHYVIYQSLLGESEQVLEALSEGRFPEFTPHA